MLRERSRVDLQTFKTKLQLVLKENSAQYWDCMRKFAQAKLTKSELDTIAKSILVTDEHIALHNLFIKSILNNASCPYPPPTPPQPATAQQPLIKKPWQGPPPATSSAIPPSPSLPAPSSSSASASKKKQKKEKGHNLRRSSAQVPVASPPPPSQQKSKHQQAAMAAAIPASPSTALQIQKKFSTVAPQHALTATSSSSQLGAAQVHPQQQHQQIAQAKIDLSTFDPYDFSSRVNTPEVRPLRNRMHRIAAENGLGHVTGEAVLFMKHAVEHYLKELIRHTKVQARDPPPVIAIHPPDSPYYPHPQPSTGVTMLPEDLLNTVETRPYLMGEDLSVNLERIAMSMTQPRVCPTNFYHPAPPPPPSASLPRRLLPQSSLSLSQQQQQQPSEFSSSDSSSQPLSFSQYLSQSQSQQSLSQFSSSQPPSLSMSQSQSQLLSQSQGDGEEEDEDRMQTDEQNETSNNKTEGSDADSNNNNDDTTHTTE